MQAFFKIISLLSAAILLAGIISNQALTYNTTSICAANCGSGIQIILTKNGKKAAVISLKNTTYINEDLLNITESAEYINLSVSEDVSSSELTNLINSLSPKALEYSKENIPYKFSTPPKTKKLQFSKNSKRFL